jgi:hypothetical protein
MVHLLKTITIGPTSKQTTSDGLAYRVSDRSTNYTATLIWSAWIASEQLRGA